MKVAGRSINLYELENYGLFSITGKDFLSVLQNLTTNNVVLFNSDINLAAQSSCFLDTKGRIISDVRIIKPVIIRSYKPAFKPNELYLLLQRSAIQKVINHMHRYTFKKDVELADITPNFDITHVSWIDKAVQELNKTRPGILFSQMYTDMQRKTVNERDLCDIAFTDPRLLKFGTSIISKKENNLKKILLANDDQKILNILSQTDYDIKRLLSHVFEVLS